MAAGSDAPAQGLVFIRAVGQPKPSAPKDRALIRRRATLHSHRDPTRKPRKDRRPAAGKDVAHRASESDTYASSLISPSRTPRCPSPASSPLDPFAAYPVLADRSLFGPQLSRVWHYHVTTYEPNILVTLPTSSSDNDEFLQLDTRINLTNKVKFLVEMLNTATVLHHRGSLPEEELLVLRGMTLACLRTALEGPPDAIPDVLPAILLMAVYEYIYGDQQVAATAHYHAFRKLHELSGKVGMAYPAVGVLLMQLVDRLLCNDMREPWMQRFLEAYTPDRPTRQRLGYSV